MVLPTCYPVTMELRPYQKEAITALKSGFAKGYLRQVLVMPTGAGKTATFSEIVALASAKRTNVVVLTDRIELFNQTYKAINRAGITVPQVEMVETYNNKIKKGKITDPPQLIIADECHKQNFTKVLNAFPFARVLGITATPIGKHFYLLYQNIVQTVDIPELVADGYLSPCKGFQMQDDLSDLKIGRNGDFTEESQYQHFSSARLFSGVIEEYKKRGHGSTVVFNCNIKHAEEMTAAFNREGITSECITSHTPKAERERILAAFEAGLFPVLNNCGILTTGWDCPRVETIIMNRATTSLPLWLQCCGRGSRIYPNKTHFTVLDFGMNFNRHGLWHEPREWKLEPPKKKKKGQDVAPIKECPECNEILAASVRNCPCGYEFPRDAKELKQGTMVEVASIDHLNGKKVSELDLGDLKSLQERKVYKASYIWRIVRSRGVGAIKNYALLCGYSPGWVWKQTQDLHNSQFNDYRIKITG